MIVARKFEVIEQGHLENQSIAFTEEKEKKKQIQKI